MSTAADYFCERLAKLAECLASDEQFAERVVAHMGARLARTLSNGNDWTVVNPHEVDVHFLRALADVRQQAENKRLDGRPGGES